MEDSAQPPSGEEITGAALVDSAEEPPPSNKHTLPMPRAPQPTIGSRATLESRVARRLAGRDSKAGLPPPPLARDNRIKVDNSERGGGRTYTFSRYEEPEDVESEEEEKSHDELIDKLRARLGADNVATEASVGRTAFRDEWGGTLDATIAVVRPVSMREVADVLRLCVDEGVPVSPGEDPDDAFARRGAQVDAKPPPAVQPHVVLNMRRPVLQAGCRGKFFDSEKREANEAADAAGQASNAS